MENSILEKEDKQIEKGFKQIYPNNNDVKISMKSWVMIGLGLAEVMTLED